MSNTVASPLSGLSFNGDYSFNLPGNTQSVAYAANNVNKPSFSFFPSTQSSSLWPELNAFPTTDSSDFSEPPLAMLFLSLLFNNSNSGPVTKNGMPRPVGGADKTTFDNKKLKLSQQALDDIWNRPGDIKQVIERELTKTLGTDNPAEVVKKVTGVRIKTGFSEERKTMLTYQLYQDILEKMAKQVQTAWKFPQVPFNGLKQTDFGRGGVELSQAALQAIRQNKTDANKIIDQELLKAIGTSNKSEQLAKILSVKNIDRSTQAFVNELYGILTRDLIKRATV